MKHDPTEAQRTEELPHYSRNNWSVELECPHCQRSGWFNKNFLGRRRVMCDGATFTKQRVTFDDTETTTQDT